MSKKSPSMDSWLAEAKADSSVSGIGMYLVHNGIVRETPKAKVRKGIDDNTKVVSMDFSYDEEKVDAAIKKTLDYPGIGYVKVWLNEGKLKLGDDIMYVLIGGDIRPHVIDALQDLVGEIKGNCVSEVETRV